MKKIVIIGCGFAGLTAASKLSRFRRELEITVIDKNKFASFLPLLPDTIGRGIKDSTITYPIGQFSRRLGLNFINEQVKAIDLDKNAVFTEKMSITYDYLILASGSQTNFYGNDKIEQYAYKLDDAEDAKVIIETINRQNFDTCVISGAGYTGIELATNLKLYFNKKGVDKRIIVIEKAASILGPLPEWMKGYVSKNLRDLDIEVLTNTTVNSVDAGSVLLSNGNSFANTMFIWVAGVRCPDFIQNLNVEKNPQGRIKVDECLRIRGNCFVAGDSGYVAYRSNYLRMAVQFAIYQAVLISKNIIRDIRGRQLHRYKPVDLGYIIPMANNKSCGEVLGFRISGIIATIMHFTMCFYRLYSLRNRLNLASDLLRQNDKL